jgi:hypothetical protein
MTKKTHEKMLTIPGHKGNANQNRTNILHHSGTPPTINGGKDAG